MNPFNRGNPMQGVRVVGGMGCAVAKLLAAWDIYDAADRARAERPNDESRQRAYEIALGRMHRARSQFVLEVK